MRAFRQTNFRNELSSIKILLSLFTAMRIKQSPSKLPASMLRLYCPNALYKVYEGVPHGLLITEKERLTGDIMSFVDNK